MVDRRRMDTEQPDGVDAESAGDGPYLRRAKALIAARADLFRTGPQRSAWLAGVSGPPQDRPTGLARKASRQLSLPLPRERQRRRARMMR
jgi:hypothetical protein